jgi:hypothetical protein
LERRRLMTLAFMRNKVVAVEPSGDGQLFVSWRLVDSLLEAAVRMKVRPPDLEITEVQAEVVRCAHSECFNAPKLTQKVVGVRVGPGMRKIVQGLMGGKEGCNELAEGILECCNGVILHYTLPQIRAREGASEEEQLEMTKAMLRMNPRMVRSCVAFADDSPIMQGLDL